MSAPREVDLVIVGSGFAGSLLALIARQLGLSVLLLERERHPRFAIGESSTPLANLLLEELARRYELPELLPFVKWGHWIRTRPDVACGLKRGFTFYHHRLGQAWSPDSTRSNQLLVAASPRDEVADTHWYRADVDHAFAKLAVGRGAELLEETTPESFESTATGAALQIRTGMGLRIIRCRFMIDASGPRGFLVRSLSLPERDFPAMPRTQALFSHFRDVARWDELHASSHPPPYPVDDAALHHVFDGGWIWVLRFGNGITSAGVAGTDAVFSRLNAADGAQGWARLLEQLPSVQEQFRHARPCQPFRHFPRLTFRASTATTEHWALAPSAAGFVDPLLSTGFPLTLLGVQRLASLLERDWRSDRWQAGLATYDAATMAELDLTARLVGALYRNLDHFETFVNLTLLYFAAASYAETARRLDRPAPADGFLLGRHPVFGAALQRCLGIAEHPGSHVPLDGFADEVSRAIEPINVAGLADRSRRNWYPARAEDLLAAAGKLGVSKAAIEEMLRRSGFGPVPE
jgi:FADH2 O2-dependent halogenase